MSEFEQYIHTIQKLGLTSIPEPSKIAIKGIYGAGILDPATDKQVENAKKYLHSDIKEGLEAFLARVVLKLVGERLIKSTATEIHKLDGGDSFFALKVGFPGLADLTDPERERGWKNLPKIRTMRIGAQGERSHFEHSTFVGIDGDDRVLKGAEIFRQRGIDELPQLRLVAQGRMRLIGPRAETEGEVEDTEILIALVNNPEVGYSKEVAGILKDYKSILRYGKPENGIFSMMSGFNSKNTHHMIRLWFDIIYTQKASLSLDFTVFARTIERRLLKRIGAG